MYWSTRFLQAALDRMTQNATLVERRAACREALHLARTLVGDLEDYLGRVDASIHRRTVRDLRQMLRAAEDPEELETLVRGAWAELLDKKRAADG